MNNLNSADFRMHIESKDKITKDERAKHLYGQYTYDTALPLYFTNIMRSLGYKNVGEQFIWLYFKGSAMGIPAPLSLKACDMLETYELKVIPNFRKYLEDNAV